MLANNLEVNNQSKNIDRRGQIMKTKSLQIAAMALISAATLIPTFSAGAQTEDNKTSSATGAPQSKAGNNRSVEKQTEDKQRTLISEAVSALDETQTALTLLDQGKKKEALEAMARASGKLDVVIAREPRLSFAPVNVAVFTLEFLGSVDEIETIVKDARSALDDGKLQNARVLVEPLASEVIIETLRLPMATYPAAIKQAAGLADKGKIVDSKNVLATALNTLVIGRTILPIPLVKAETALDEAETLASKGDRSAEDSRKLAELLKLASDEVQRAKAFGYGKKEDLKQFQSQIKDLQKKSEGQKSGNGWFQEIKGSLSKLFKSSGDLQSARSSRQ
jgi:hypothetical protein